MDTFHFYIHKPKSIYITTNIQFDDSILYTSYETINCLGHKTDLKDFHCQIDEIVKKRKCLKMFWSLDDVVFMTILLGAIGFFCYLLQGPWRGICDYEILFFFLMLIAVTVLFFILRFTQTIELTLRDGTVRLIPIGAFLLGPSTQHHQNKITRFCKRIYLDF